MSISELEKWFSDSPLDLSFSFKSTAILRPSGPELFSPGSIDTATQSSPRIGDDEKYRQEQGERPQIEKLPEEQVLTKGGPPGDHDKAAGTALLMDKAPILPILEFHAMDINPPPQKPKGQPRIPPKELDNTLLSTAESGIVFPHPPSAYKPYTPQRPQITKSTPTHPSLAMSASRVPPVSMGASTMPTDTAFDCFYFTIPPQISKYPSSRPPKPQNENVVRLQDSSGNPQPRPKQFIQQSARRPHNRVTSPRRTSFITTQKSHRSNSRGPTRRKSTKILLPGKSRTMGNTKNMPISSTGTQRVQVLRRPSRKPIIVGIPARSRSRIPPERVPEIPAIWAPDFRKLPTGKSVVSQGQRGALIEATSPSQSISKSHSVLSLMKELPTPERPIPPPKDIPGKSYTPWPGIKSISRSATLAPSQEKPLPEPRAASAPPFVAKARLAEMGKEKREVKPPTKEGSSEVPEILRIGNRKNMSLFRRLVSLESLDVRSRY